MEIEKNLPFFEAILTPWKEKIGVDYLGYRNHCYRVMHFCFALRACSEEEKRKIMIAAAHHDLGLWSAGTVAYLEPSILEARRYCEAHGYTDWIEEISLLISEHHKLRAYTDVRYPLVEVFRKADLVDFSLGFFKKGVSGQTYRMVRDAFPNAGFHKFLMRGAKDWFVKHPLSMPPFMKW